MVLSSNEKRSLFRQQYREAMAAHIRRSLYSLRLVKEAHPFRQPARPCRRSQPSPSTAICRRWIRLVGDGIQEEFTAVELGQWKCGFVSVYLRRIGPVPRGSYSADAANCPIRTGPPGKKGAEHSDPSSRLWGLHSADDTRHSPPQATK
jgi:hypothetical protein